MDKNQNRIVSFASWILCFILLSNFTLKAELSQGTVEEDMFDMSLEELIDIDVSSASFFITSTRKAPGYVMVYNIEDIENTSIRTLSDLFEMHIPGSVSAAHQRQGRLVGTRGITIDNNAKTLVMWDSQQINFRMHFGYMVGMLSPFMSDIAKIEVIQGPGAIMHGSGAINGFVNMVPKTGSSHPGGFARYEYGIAERSQLVEGGYGFTYGQDNDFFLYGGSYYAEGFEPDDNWEDPDNYSEDKNVFGYQNNNFRVSSVWNHGDFNLNTFIYQLEPQKNSNDEYGTFMNRAFGIKPKYNYEISDTDEIEISLSMLLMDFGDIGANNNRNPDYHGGSEEHGDIKAVYKTTAFDNHQLALGGLWGKKHFHDTQYQLGNDPPEGFESIHTKWEEASLFAEDIIELSDQLTLSVGVRYDKYHMDPIYNDSNNSNQNTYNGADPGKIAGHVSPRVALAYEYDEETIIKASYQNGFRMPDAIYYNWNLFNNAAASALGYKNSPLLKPEEMDSYELNLEKHFNDKLTVNTNIFYNVFSDQLAWGELENYWTDDEVAAINQWTPAASWGWGGGMFQNIEGDFAVYGSEMMVDYDFTDELAMSTSYSFARAENDYIEQKYPTHQIKTHFTAKTLNDKLILGLSYIYNSSYTEEINSAIDDNYKVPRNVIDLSAVYKVTDNFRLKGTAKNVFGDATPPPGFLMESPSWGNSGYDEPRYYLSAELLF